MKQLPVLPPESFDAPCPWSPTETLADWIRPRVLELVYTAWDMQPFARDLGFDGPPFVWDDARRRGLRAELDATFFHLYGLDRDDTAYVLDTFPIVRRDDEARFGTFLTKDLVVAAYDRFAADTIVPFVPPPLAGPAVPPVTSTPLATSMLAAKPARPRGRKKTWHVMEYLSDTGGVIGWAFLTAPEYARWQKHPRSDRHMVQAWCVVASMESLAEEGAVPCASLLDFRHTVDALPSRELTVDAMGNRFAAVEDPPPTTTQ